MTNSDLFPAAVLRRKAVVYVRQSTQSVNAGQEPSLYDGEVAVLD